MNTKNTQLEKRKSSPTMTCSALRERVFISFSGGQTSAYMTFLLVNLLEGKGKDVEIIFANTGCENEKTLEFVDRCDREWDLGVIWIECVPRGQGEGVGYKVVNFETASRDGEPFEDAVEKYGLFGPSNPGCSERLKERPMTKYLREVKGWGPNTYSTAIGIRIDEIDRMSPNAVKKYGAIYPLIGWDISKVEVEEFWKDQSFRLGLPEHHGNCQWCWKKSKRKLMTIALERREWFDFPAKLERKYKGPKGQDQRIFRGNMTTGELLTEACKRQFKPFKDSKVWAFEPELDLGGACGESCEVFADRD